MSNSRGQLNFNAFQTRALGPTGDIIVANIVATALGAPGQTSPLLVTVTTLADTDGSYIRYGAINGASVKLESTAPPERN